MALDVRRVAVSDVEGDKKRGVRVNGRRGAQ